MRNNSKNLIKKYEEWGFLEDVPLNKKMELCILYEKTISFLEKNEENWWESINFNVIFLPILKYVYLNHQITDYSYIYDIFKSWYLECKDSYDDDLNLIMLFISFFKKSGIV